MIITGRCRRQYQRMWEHPQKYVKSNWHQCHHHVRQIRQQCLLASDLTIQRSRVPIPGRALLRDNLRQTPRASVTERYNLVPGRKNGKVMTEVWPPYTVCNNTEHKLTADSRL